MGQIAIDNTFNYIQKCILCVDSANAVTKNKTNSGNVTYFFYLAKKQLIKLTTSISPKKMVPQA
jgi:hypothetical protein